MEGDQDLWKAFKPEKLKWGKKLASGGYGDVFAGAYDGKKVAIKVMIGSAFEQAFQREVWTWIQCLLGQRKISPPKQLKSCYCIVSEFLPGGTLAAYIIKPKKIAFSRKLQLALDAARGVSHLHSKNILHRDVKLENLLLDGEGRVKILDFGISRIEDVDMSVNVGSRGYKAPEVMIHGSYDCRCDVFSFGICLWEIYYQKRAQLNLSTTPRIGDDCPEDLANLMRRCWRDCKDRPKMTEVAKDLEDMLSKTEDDMGSDPVYINRVHIQKVTSIAEEVKIGKKRLGCFFFFQHLVKHAESQILLIQTSRRQQRHGVFPGGKRRTKKT
ncbi:OLC1v1034105C1 [Oldenlandia corymbosa var. corymbosa]|uniref:OLC1v1034105C1 n=1 Tax=Oldenlandia corymbosa var. corymbosa TaxID=529605 RepID=A0AAV1CPT0_OLDCO|nr:OLC1v1034105C1 [Oldenlandia corymbosa var. corymbosa]